MTKPTRRLHATNKESPLLAEPADGESWWDALKAVSRDFYANLTLESIALYALAAFTLIFILGCLWIQMNDAQKVVTTEPAGTVVGGTFMPDVLGDRTKVETDRGVYLVNGTMQIFKGTSLMIETRANSSHYLCSANENEDKTCAEFAR